MQSTSLKTAQPVLSRNVAKAFVTFISAVLLVGALAFALAVVRGPSAAVVTPEAAVEQALIQHRADERAAFVAVQEAALAEQALIDHRIGEKGPMLSPAALADTYRWIGSYAPRMDDGKVVTGGGGRGRIPQ
jgi:hypothetical protein